jgi:uncharacterized membrane protein (UPF0127 family)
MSLRKDVFSWGLIILVLGLVAAAAIYILWPQLQPHVTVRLGDGVFAAKVAKTSDAREKGLSGTNGLREDQALLFVYETNDKWPIWMKDMNYPIDIVWLDKDKKVVYIVKNAPPESYPYETFTPKQEARYVLEIPAGTVGRKSITIGTEAMFDENTLEGFGL